MLLPELWSFLIYAQGWKQEGTQASHYCSLVFSFVCITACWWVGGVSKGPPGLVSCFCVRSQGAAKTPARELFLDAFRQVVPWSASLTIAYLECGVGEEEKTIRLHGPCGHEHRLPQDNWHGEMNWGSDVLPRPSPCSPIQIRPLLCWPMFLKLWEPGKYMKFCSKSWKSLKRISEQ